MLHCHRGATTVITVQPATTAAEFEQAADLIGELVDWIRTTMGVDLGVEQPELRAELASLAERYDGTAAALFLASRDGAVVGTVAVRRHDGGSAELKRMFVRPAARGTGAGPSGWERRGRWRLSSSVRGRRCAVFDSSVSAGV
jgi:GNAT superfamily N-acetyltransferase